MTQSASTVTLSGSSSHSFGGNTGTALIYAVIQGLNMGDINTFALGDGTAKAQFVHNAATHNGEVSWNGDDKLNLGDVTTGDYYSTVHEAALPSATTPAPNFTSEETWDCAAEGEFETVNFATLNASPTFQSDFQACNDNFGFGGEGGGQGFIDCPHAGD